jgi:pimeloyl-ACP methyl ester carboxylesterase
MQTSHGAVGYRTVGRGSPLVLIVGYSGSQDSWPPSLVNALAQHHQVITFDNAGIGQTAMLSGALTISAMADQTAAFTEALHLNHPDVLGWSMGGMIAQALVVRHPADVRRLVLSATFAGDGKATLPSASVWAALTSPSSPSEVLALLFPPDRLAAESAAFVKSLSEYPNPYQASPAVEEAQFTAIAGWTTGAEQAGHGAIAVPTLIGDGADDVLTPPANAQKMAALIPGATVVIYPDAGHGFVIQEATAWAARVNQFLGQ